MNSELEVSERSKSVSIHCPGCGQRYLPVPAKYEGNCLWRLIGCSHCHYGEQFVILPIGKQEDEHGVDNNE